jgi:trk system potassium uptake protein
MYVLIGGSGLVGLSLAQKLVELRHTVAVVDIDPIAFEGSAVQYRSITRSGNM